MPAVQPCRRGRQDACGTVAVGKGLKDRTDILGHPLIFSSTIQIGLAAPSLMLFYPLHLFTRKDGCNGEDH
jgi:hypothetical protein